MSAMGDILNAVRDVVSTLAPNRVKIKIRKRPWGGELEEFPSVIISPGNAPSIESEHTENTIVWNRSVWVTLISPTGDGKFDIELDYLMNLEESIRQALHKPTLSGASTVFDADVSPEPPFISTAVDAGYDLTAIEVVFKSQETREV